MTIPICPRCGKSNTTIVNARCYGWMEGSFDEEGIEIEFDNDGLLLSLAKTVRCDLCGEIRRDLTVIDRRVVKR
jgi:hypothetical protein